MGENLKINFVLVSDIVIFIEIIFNHDLN